MRVIGGRWRSRPIEWPTTGNTRPITDRVKEAVFDSLGSRFGTPGSLPALRVADVFAGGGSLGIEALSRGAARATFFERDCEAVRILKRNLDRLQVGPEGTIVRADVWRRGVRPPGDFAPLGLVFLDPPFADVRETSEESRLGSLLRRLAGPEVTEASGLVILRHPRHVVLPDVLAGHWKVDSSRRYGASTVTTLTRREDH